MRSSAFLIMLSVFVLTFWALKPAKAERVVPQDFTEVQLSYAPLVERVSPAVVNVYTRKVVTERAVSPLFNDPFWQRFFGGRTPRQRQRVQNSLGSGVLVSGDGIIVTNQHVIEGADEITIALTDRREFDADVLLTDERTDLAVLKIDTDGQVLPHLTLADSDDLLVGDTVMAIGNPFGVGQSISVGIVSALARTQVVNSDVGYFIQTDAAINPGNSGGALVNMRGALVGINTAIFTRSGGSNGIGFAIPADMVRTFLRVAQSEDKEFRRPWLGVSGQVVTSDIAAGLGMDRPIGVLLNSVYPGGSADEAGLQEGDVIVTVEGQEVFDVPSVNYRLITRGMGDQVDVEVLRRGQRLTTMLTVRMAPEEPARNVTELPDNSPLGGVQIGNMSPAFNQELGIDMQVKGVIVLRVQRGSYAQRIGLRPGERIDAINDQEIRQVEDVVSALAQLGERWTVTLSNGERSRTIRIRQ